MRRLLAPLVLACACTAPRPAPLAPAAPEVRPPAAGSGQVYADELGVTRRASAGRPAWTVRVGLFPPADPLARRTANRKMAVGPDGTVLTGASDGSLLGLDAEGAPLFQLGVRGAVTGIEARPDGDFSVSTSAGAVVVGPRGAVRSETASEPTPWRPTTAYRAHREPLRNVGSVLALAPDDVWALVRGDRVPAQDEPPYRLVHHDGRAWSDLGVPAVRFAKEVFAEGHPAATGTFTASSLARGPTGALLVIGARTAEAKRMCVLERVGSGFRERRELFAVVARIRTVREAEQDTLYAASPGGHEVLCNNNPSTCVELGPGLAPRLLPDGAARKMPDGDRFSGRRDSHAVPLVFAGETLWQANGWATGASDVWGLHEAAVIHWDGKSFESRESPLSSLDGVWASGRDDLWLTGAGGVARFDGERWWRLLGIEGRGLSVTGSGRGDVWVFGQAGLWHVTPDPQAPPQLTGTPAPAPPASAPSLALPIAGVDPSYRLERVVLEVDGGAPLRDALSLAEGPGGVVWLYDGARVVEHDGTRARVLYQAPRPESFVCWSAPEPDCEVCAQCTEPKGKPLDCQRCVAPSAAGEGTVLAEGLLRITGGHAATQATALPGLVAVAATPSGTLWAISGGDDDRLPHAVVQGPGGLRLVAGLPPAGYADVAARADDDVWMAGGLATGIERAPDAPAPEGRAWPAGEGTLVRFDGRTFMRHRAPDGALLSVVTAGAGEAWAVGVAGGVLHVKAGAAEAFHVDREGGGRLGVTLRGVATAGAEVWMAGDGATLLRWDGKALLRVDASAAGRGAALAAVIAPGARPGWVVGPGGIWRVVRAR